jgi:hypothetical protein
MSLARPWKYGTGSQMQGRGTWYPKKFDLKVPEIFATSGGGDTCLDDKFATEMSVSTICGEVRLSKKMAVVESHRPTSGPSHATLTRGRERKLMHTSSAKAASMGSGSPSLA